MKQIFIPGQAPLSQLSDFSSLDPSELQLFPPFFGAGSTHFRTFVRVPTPQVTEQDPQPSQEPHFPLTNIVRHVNLLND